MASRRYKVDFAAYMADCEANYWRILKLLPTGIDRREFRVQATDRHGLQLVLRVEERCRYTTMVSIYQEGWGDWIGSVLFEVRLYHDAKMAEVFSCQRKGRIHGVYGYPNEGMFQPDEKFQQHRFLAECLMNCQKNGFTETPVPVL